MSECEPGFEEATVLLVASDGFLRAARSHLEAEYDDVSVVTESSPDGVFDRLPDGEVDCLVADDVVIDDVAAFSIKARSENPDLPMVIRTDHNLCAAVPNVFDAAHTDILWRTESEPRLDELAARLTGVISASNGRGRPEDARRPEERPGEGRPQQEGGEGSPRERGASTDSRRHRGGTAAHNLDREPPTGRGRLTGSQGERLVRGTTTERRPPRGGSGEDSANPGTSEAESAVPGTTEADSVNPGTSEADSYVRGATMSSEPTGRPTSEGVVVDARDGTERKDRLQKLERLPDVASDLGATETMAEVADLTVATLRDVLDMAITGVWLFDDEEAVLEPVSLSPESEDRFEEHPTIGPTGSSLPWKVFETGEAYVNEDRTEDAPSPSPGPPLRAEMLFPLGEYGLVVIGSTERTTVGDVDVHFARILVSMAEFALERLDNEQTLTRQQEELRQQNEQLDEFASVVSHDLRNPLNVAGLRVDLARQERESEDLEAAAAALERVGTIIEDVLILAREGRTIGDVEPIDLDAVTADAWEGVETGDTDLTLATDLTLLADEKRLRRLLENLVRNAIEHGDADAVRVGSYRTDDGSVRFFVEDDGPGIPESDREEVFEAGFTTASHGIGFGLAIVERIAEAHDWSVSVTEGDLSGARFEVAGVESA